MWSRLKNTTQYKDSSNSDICVATQRSDNTLAKMEYILRYFNSAWYSPFGNADLARKFCDEELIKHPGHNFFNYARAQLEEDKEKKKKYLKNATKNCVYAGKEISAQAAYETSHLFYFSEKEAEINHCYAWLSKAMILKSEDACNDFVNNNLFSKKIFGPIATCLVFLTTYLSGVKIPGLAKSKLLHAFGNRDDGSPNDASIFLQAYEYPNSTNILLELDSPARKIAEWILVSYATNFVVHFTYCLENEILNQETFLGLMQFYFSSNYTNKNDLRQWAINYLNKRNPLYLAPLAATQYAPIHVTTAGYQYTQPVYQTPVYGYPIAPSVDTSAYTSSYYSMYSQAPQMMPVAVTGNPLYATQIATQQTAQPELVPTYIPRPQAAEAPVILPRQTVVARETTDTQSDNLRAYTFVRY